MGNDTIYILIFSTFQWLALLLAIITFKKYKNTPEGVFLYFLIYAVAITELSAFTLGYYGISSYFIYNIYTLVSIILIHYWFYKIIQNSRIVVTISLVIFICVFIYMFSYNTFFTEGWYLPMIVGSISTAVFSGIYFIQLILKDTELKIIKTQRFWIIVGLLIFNLGIVPVLIFQEQLQTAPTIFNFIIVSLNIILYGCFIVSFLSLYRKKK